MMTQDQINALPRELKELKQWTFWKKVSKTSAAGVVEITKPPCNKDGYSHDCTLPANLLTFEPALKTFLSVKGAGKVAGIGFAFNEKGISGIDVDHCVDEAGNLTEDARQIVDRVNSYTEVSPSGTGLHILVRGTIPEKYRKPPTDTQKKRGETKGYLGGKSGAFEAYSSGRYFTVTGNGFENRNKIEERQEALTWFWETFIKTESAPIFDDHGEEKKNEPTKANQAGIPRNVQEVIRLIENCGNSEKFKTLMDATDGEPDRSKADLSLLSILAFYCRKDNALMEAVFNCSKLAERDKWKRKDYRTRSIEKALSQTTKVFEPGTKSSSSVAKSQTPEEWSKTICFLDKIALPKFPSHCLPNALRGYVEAVADCRQVPVDLPAFLALAVGATAGARKYRVYIGTSHTEPLNIWTVSALPPGSRKTDTFEDLAKPLHMEQSRLSKSMIPVIEEARTLQKIHEKRMEYLLNRVAKENDSQKREDLEEELAELGQSGIKVPSYPCLIASGDTTPEAAAALLEEQNGRIAIMDTEGGLFSMIAGRYDAKGESNMDVWLKMHAGDELSIHRKNRPPIEVSKPAGTVAITVQPAVIKDLATKKDFKDRGLLGRFLYALPESLIGKRFYQHKHVDQTVKDSYLAAIKRIFEQPGAEPKDENDKTPHHRLYIRGAALEIWEEFYNDLEKRQAQGGDLENITDWASKCAGAIARIAGIFHIVETGGNPDQDEISGETMARAYEIGRQYLIEHAKAAYGLMNMTADAHLARDILSWIAAKEKTVFTASDYWEGNRSKAEKLDDLIPGFELLEDRGIVREFPETKTTGRKAKHKYEVNPSCKACFRCLKDE